MLFSEERGFEMAGRGLVYGGGDALNHKQQLKISSPDLPLESIVASNSTNSFVGSRAMVSFGAVNMNKPRNWFYRSFDQEESGDEYLDEYFNHSEKKRRLTADQVQFLEKSFEAENKLEPERKNQLAMELGLQPRQIAIWFQNRRARLRTKQVEADYEILRARYNSLKTNYDNLLKENEKLKAEVFCLKDNALATAEEKEKSQQCDAQALPVSLMERSVPFGVCEDEESKLLAIACKHEDQSSVISDMTDAESPTFAKGILSALNESGNSWQVFEPDPSDCYQNGEDNLNDESLQLYVLPKIEDSFCYTSLNTWNLGLPVEDHGFGLWSY